MTDMPRTARFALPLLAIAQAQKEITHNEALTLIDAIVHAAIEDGPLVAPPPTPSVGQCWIADAAATGEWAGQNGALAVWTDGGWRFAPPREAMRVLRLADGAWLRYSAGAWRAPAHVAAPAGGAVADSEARASIFELIQALEAHGILISS